MKDRSACNRLCEADKRRRIISSAVTCHVSVPAGVTCACRCTCRIQATHVCLWPLLRSAVVTKTLPVSSRCIFQMHVPLCPCICAHTAAVTRRGTNSQQPPRRQSHTRPTDQMALFLYTAAGWLSLGASQPEGQRHHRALMATSTAVHCLLLLTALAASEFDCGRPLNSNPAGTSGSCADKESSTYAFFVRDCMAETCR